MDERHEPGKDPASRRGLRVWRSRSSAQFWAPETGALTPPSGWSLVPRGDAYLTRAVKRGPHWVVLERNGPYTSTIGVLCPIEGAEEARRAATSTAAGRAARRRVARAARSRLETAYQEQLEASILSFLRFAPPHEELACSIARAATRQAAEVRSGRVGRSKLLPLEARAELAARAYIRHRHTRYEAKLRKLAGSPFERDERGLRDDLYRIIKEEANDAVDAFLEGHRQLPRKGDPPRV